MFELEIVKWIVFGGLSIVVWFLKMNITETKEKLQTLTVQKDDIKAELAHVKLNYLHRDDFKEFKIELRSMFEEIREDVKALRGK
jgi:hypothetical protein